MFLGLNATTRISYATTASFALALSNDVAKSSEPIANDIRTILYVQRCKFESQSQLL